MTLAIAAVSSVPPVVQRCSEAPTQAAPWELKLLGSRIRRVHVREVTLLVDGTGVLAARTVTTLHDPALMMLRRLGDRPLAEVLFTDPRWRRSAAPVPLLVKPGTAPGDPLYGRACVWERTMPTGGRVLVEEYFLPALVGGVSPDRRANGANP